MSPDLLVLINLGLSTLIQFGVAWVAWSGVREAGRYRFAWRLLSLATLLMLERRVVPFYLAVKSLRTISDFHTKAISPLDSTIALLISTLLLFGLLGVRSLVHTLNEQEESLRRYAETDALTGLLNRRSLTRDALREVQRVSRTGQAMSAVLVDLDHFKELNDRWGHEAGDAALVHVSGVLRKQLRDIDLVARWGGEEFLIILPGTGAGAAYLTAQRLRRAILDHRLEPSAKDWQVTASFGVATLSGPTDAPERALALLIRQSDSALYLAKQRGRDRVAIGEEIEPEQLGHVLA